MDKEAVKKKQQIFNSGRNWLCGMLGALLYVAQRSGHKKKKWSGSIW